MIKKLKDKQGNWVIPETCLKALLTRYFESVYCESSSISVSVVEAIQSWVSMEQNNLLHRPFSPKEIRDAFFSMHDDKAPDVDGLNPGFYKHF